MRCDAVWCKGCGGIVSISCYNRVSENNGDGNGDDIEGVGQSNHHQIALVHFIQNKYHISIFHKGNIMTKV